MTADSKTTFFDLSPELRNRVYEFVVLASHSTTAEDNIVIVSSCDGEPPQRIPALLGASRQTRNQALPMYYVLNTFRAEVASYSHAYERMALWFDAIGPEAASKIIKLEVLFKPKDLQKATRLYTVKDYFGQGRSERRERVLRILGLHAEKIELDWFSRRNNGVSLQFRFGG